MSNTTFAWFRKNEKLAFAVLTLVAIIAFVASDFFLSWSRRGRTDHNGSTSLVKYDGRNISIDEFQHLMSAHHAAYEFTNRVEQLAGNSRMTGPRAFGPVQLANQEQFAQFLFFSDQAKRQGIDFSNEEITNYLRDLSNDAPMSEIAKARDEVIRDGKVITEEKLFDAIRADLRRQEFVMLSMSGFLASYGQRAAAVTPGEEWENFKRIYRRVSIEALPINVADFEGDVKGEPSDAELKEIYEKGKNYLAGNPYTPVAGMIVDRKLAFQFVKVDQSKLEKEEMEKITEEEVRKLYDQRVEKKDRSVTEVVPVDQPGIDSKPEEGSDKTDSGAEGAKPASDDASGSKDAPAGDKQAEENKEEKPAEPADEKPSDEKPAEEGKQSSAAKKAEYFTALQDQPAEEKQADEAAKDETAKDEGADKEKGAEESTAEKPATEKPADSEAEATEDEPTVKKPKKPLPKTETRILPYEKVSEDLRKELAAPAVNLREEKIFNSIQAALDAYLKAVKKWESDVKKSDVSKVGKSPVVDEFLAPVLKDLMLESEAYGPKDQFEIDSTQLGKIRWFDGQTFQRFSAFYRSTFQQVTMPFRCTRLDGERPFRYIWWVTKDEPRKLLTQEEAGERLRAAWRKDKAFALAVEAAKKLSQEAGAALEKKTGKDDPGLTGAFAEKPPRTGDSFKTAPFSYYDLGNLPFGAGGQITLSEVPEVEYAGDDFMKAVFALKLGETGVAYDAGQNHVYVIRVATEGPQDDQLRQDFIDRSPDRFAGTISRDQSHRVFTDWLDEMAKRRDFDASQLRRGGSGE